MRNTKVTMAEVARRAGVAPTTVARVLYANGYVAADKREIVEKTLKETGYRPNVFARGLRTNRSFTLGMVSFENPANPFFVRIAQEVQVAALHAGLTVLTLNHTAQKGIEKTGIQRFIDQNVGAIIFCSAVDPNNIAMAIDAGAVVVQVERQISFAGRLALVDPFPGMRQAVDHLASLGHRRIGYIGARPGIDHSELPLDRSVEANRMNAFRWAMQENGLSVDDRLIHLGLYYSPPGEPHPQGYLLMRRLLDSGEIPTAIITGSDVLAAGVLQAIYEKNIRVPDDISLIGFDDSFASFLTPALTTIAQPVQALAEGAIKLALMEADEISETNTNLLFPTELMIRNSTGRSRTDGSR